MVPSSDQALLAEVVDRLRAMAAQEVSPHYAVTDYLAPEHQVKLRAVHGAGAVATSPILPPRVRELWREKICEWCYSVVDHYDLDREVVAAAMSYLDRYLASRPADRRSVQLAAMAALRLAAKLFGTGAELRTSSLVLAGSGAGSERFAPDQVAAAEEALVWTLRWRLHPPTPLAFGREVLRLATPPRADEDDAAADDDGGRDAWHELAETARYLTELSACDYWFATRRPSSIAMASILHASELRRCGGPSLSRAIDAGMELADREEVDACRERIGEIYRLAGLATMEPPKSPTSVGGGP
ncbi:hypothetical protein ACHAWF_012180 [Thalassiosira exigua]